MTTRGITAVDRLQLQRLGWRPTPVVGKAAMAPDWVEGGNSPERVACDNAAVPNATGTGIITGEVVAVDNDLLNLEHAVAIEEAITTTLGDTAFRRFGSKPCPMLIYFCAAPRRKITVSGRLAGENCDSRVEFLGKGQQFVAFGLHPDTFLPYRWEHEELFDPLSVSPDCLPGVTPKEIEATAIAVANTMTRLGYIDVKISGVSREKIQVSVAKASSPITLRTLMEMLAFIPPSCDRNTWIAVGGALKNAEAHNLICLPDLKNPDPLFNGMEVFADWSGGKFSPAGNPLNYVDREDCEDTWNTLDAEKLGGATLGSIIWHAQNAGYKGPTNRTAAETFKEYAVGHSNPDVPFHTPSVKDLSHGSDIEIADAVLSNLRETHGEVIYCEGALWRFDGQHWQPIGEPEMYQTIYHYDGVKYGEKGRVRLSKGRCESILHAIRMRTEDREFFRNAPIGINCKSGLIHFNDGKPNLEPHRREHRQRHLLPGSWHPGAKWGGARLLNKFFEGCFGENADCAQRILLAGEILGAAALGITPKLPAPKALVLYGPLAANGKSEFLNLVRGLLPLTAVSALPPSKFGDDAMLAQLVGKSLNCADELGTTYSIASETFKAIITGNEITARHLYRDPISFSPSALHIFATNVLPPFTGGFDRGVQRRLLPLEFTRVIPKSERIPNIGTLIAGQECNELLAFAVEGAVRLFQQQQFSEPPTSRELLKSWVYGADPVIAWLGERVELIDGHRVLTRDAYTDFVGFAANEGYNGARLPAVHNFVQRLTSQDPRIKGGGRTKAGRYLEGLRLRPNNVTR